MNAVVICPVNTYSQHAVKSVPYSMKPTGSYQLRKQPPVTVLK